MDEGAIAACSGTSSPAGRHGAPHSPISSLQTAVWRIATDHPRPRVSRLWADIAKWHDCGA